MTAIISFSTDSVSRAQLCSNEGMRVCMLFLVKKKSFNKKKFYKSFAAHLSIVRSKFEETSQKGKKRGESRSILDTNILNLFY